ncbi:hypothetical protein [Corallococcus macrosporus]|uniref:Uncharacterized protein n=1 Tax=Corallococcus macrosporus DSM 14697 TaxID=1189310 RepID=A0A250JZS7_9BACT|nr:hypothetical protein [Corallococcus macrosporus]ATB49354.1 hypothetical protein MYMAC_004997 [Corallococcus macrosporus DSM 14697]
MSPKTSVLEPLRVRVRRFQFIMGLGFIALIAGSILSVALTFRLSVRIQAVPVATLRVLLWVLLENLWVLGVLPVLCYGAARVMELRAWTTAGGAALTGALFVNAMAFIQNGVHGLWAGDIGSLFSLVAFAGGVVLSARAVRMGREAAAQQSVKAQSKAQERKSEYDEFLRAAEQGAARLEQREAQATPAGVAPTGAEEAQSTVAAVAPVASEAAQATSAGVAPVSSEEAPSTAAGVAPVSSSEGGPSTAAGVAPVASEAAQAPVGDAVPGTESAAEALSSAAQAQPAGSEAQAPSPAAPEPTTAAATGSDTSKAPAA